jgi:hydrogenase small subunit
MVAQAHRGDATRAEDRVRALPDHRHDPCSDGFRITFTLEATMKPPSDWVRRELERRGVSRRDFMTYCGAVAALLALPRSAAGEVAAAIERAAKPRVVWLEYQDCAGCTESFLRARAPTVAELVLDVISVDYHETIMAAAGHRAEEALRGAIAQKGQYLAIVEGSIPTGEGGAYCTIGGRSAIESAREVLGNAAAVIAVGTCASFGGLPAAEPNPTGALSVEEAFPSLKALVNMPGCPVNAENVTALVVHFLTYGRWPALDQYRRPLFAYGKCIHDACERRAHYDAGQFVERWGDEGHRSGYCLYKMGCKGPASFHNCPNVGWNEKTSWPVACGHPCIGCAEPRFWDTMTPFYSHISDIAGKPVDEAGLWLTGGVAAALAGHGLIRLGARVVEQRRAKKEQAAAGEAAPTTEDDTSKKEGES